ncbi:MAG: L-threonylcarbamoyladenylate synthase [Pseudonocardiaceae bacterium]
MKTIHGDELHLAVAAVEAGDLVVLPTRRWYMICAAATNADACDRIFQGKRRPKTKSLAFVIPHTEAAADLFALTPQAKALASAFWPGDLALMLPRADPARGQRHAVVGTPHALVTQAPGVLGELATRARVPIAATTVNISGTQTEPGPAIIPSEVTQFVDQTGVDPAYLVDGGICPIANHLTIVDCTARDARIVRSGVIHDRAVNAAIDGV